MSTFDLTHNIASRPTTRRLSTLVESITYYRESIGVSSITYPDQSEFECLVFDNQEENIWTEESIEALRVECTIERWSVRLMEEANLIQRSALSLHTISTDFTLTQKSMYDIKFSGAVDYTTRVDEWRSLNSTQEFPDDVQVPVPIMIKNEGLATGDPYYYLCMAIIDNYQQTSATLQAYYGLIEGERRLTKKRIKMCKTSQDLINVQWANWPLYEGNPPKPSD